MASGENEARNPFAANQDAAPASAKSGASREDERASKRHPCSGKAKVLTPVGKTLDGRMFDISMTGASIFLDAHLTADRSCTLTVSVFKAGMLHHFQVRARLVHASLAGQQGFKHGFDFDKPDSAASKALAGLTNTGASAFG